MPIILRNLKTPITASKDDVVKSAIKKLRISESEVISAGIYKSSLDARKREDIHFVSSVTLSLKSSELEQRLSKLENVSYFEETELNPEISTQKRDGRVVIAGFGPAGMFCGLLLAEMG